MILNRVASFFVGVVERWMPDPFLFCILLTALTYVLALWQTSTGPFQLVAQWYAGLWQILPFAMQMILILLTGYTLASSRPVRRGLVRIASLPRSQGSAILWVTFSAIVLSLINWGVALVAAALLAREMARRVPGCDFGFLVAGAYSGFVIWGSGLSSSIALVSATEGSDLNFIARYTGVPVTGLDQTLFSPVNQALVLSSLVLMPIMFRLMMPRTEQVRIVEAELLVERDEEEVESTKLELHPTPAQRLEQSPLVLALLALLGAAFLVGHFATQGATLDLNVVILLFLVLGMALHRRPLAYARSFSSAGKLAGPLVLQYPLYGGIMGMMQQSGLAEALSRGFVDISSATTFPLYAFFSALIVNLFVPSAGGQWAVQGPVMVPAALQLGVSPAVTAMAVAFGDQTSNMLQPFWALPVLAIAGLRIRDIMGYCVMTFLLSTLLSILSLLLFA